MEHLVAPEPEGYEPTSLDTVGALPHEWLDHRARLTPDTVAVTQRGVDWTYSQLRERSIAYAAIVTRQVQGISRCVPIVSGSNVETLAAMLGVMRAGCVAIAIDAVDGAQRIGAVLDDVEPDLVFGDRHSLALTGSWGRVACAFEDVEPAAELATPSLTRDHAARIVFTSGSTGRPKGHVQTYDVLVDWMFETVRMDNLFGGDRVGNPTSLSSAACTSQVLGSIFVGAHLHQFDVNEEGIEAFPRWVGASRLTWVKTAPAVLRNVLRSDPDPEPYRDLRVLRLTGDRILPSDLEAIVAVLQPSCRVAMHYGSTEAGPIARLLWTPGWEIPRDRLTVGWPMSGRTVRILGETGEPLPVGDVGLFEVSKAGPVARPFTGADSLVPRAEPYGEPVVFGDLARQLPDGQIDVVGRTNARVKIHGRAVDLVEIEQALRAVPGVAGAAVVLEPDAARPRLVAHVVRRDPSLTAADVLDGARPRLAQYMVPSLVRWWDELPMTARGKLDRHALVAASTDIAASGDGVGATSELETQLLAIWSEVLGVRGLGVTDRFFDVGGDSLRAYQVVVLIEERLGAGVSTASLLTAPTVREQAELIRTGQGRPHAVLVPLRATGSGPAVCFVHGLGGSALTGLQLVNEMSADRPVWGLHLESPERAEEFGSIGELADAYVAEVVGQGLRGPIALVGWSLGGMIVWDMAQRLPAAGVEVERVVILDTGVATRSAVDMPQGVLASWSYRVRRNVRWVPWQCGRAMRHPVRAMRAVERKVRTDEPTRPQSVIRIESALGTLAHGWAPSKASFAVDVVASEGRTAHHRLVWPAATSGPVSLTTVRSAYHLDLMTNRVDDTARIVGRLLR